MTTGPSWFTVSSDFFHGQGSKQGNVNRIRQGEVAATAIVVATGWAVSARSSNNTALWVALGISAIFVAGYELAMAHPAREDGQK